MVQVNDTVLYGSQSVCTVTEICEKTVGKEKLRYYALKPVYDGKSTVYVPCANGKLVGKMRRILSAAEIHALIDSLAGESLGWIENDALRRERYGEILAGIDRRQLALLIRTANRSNPPAGNSTRPTSSCSSARKSCCTRNSPLCCIFSPRRCRSLSRGSLRRQKNNAAGRAGIAKRAEMWYV